MIVDTSVWIDHLSAKPHPDLELFRHALRQGRVVMAPVVLTELLSSPDMPPSVEKALLELTLATPKPDFWESGGKLRRRLARAGLNASLADCLILQSALEQGLPLLTRDQAQKKFAAKAGVVLLG
jgi:predicted nucleic acid-binding protein